MFENLTADFSQFLTIGVSKREEMEFLFFGGGGGAKSFPRSEKNSSNPKHFVNFYILHITSTSISYSKSSISLFPF
jgi:hypothetical protein